MKNVCESCSKSFASKKGLKTHIESAHNNQEFRESSQLFNAAFSKTDRLDQGIFFTPKKARDVLFDKLQDLGITPKIVLEPSFGSGEFIYDINRIYPNAHILGVEKNKSLFDSVSCPNSTLTCCDFLDYQGKADLIIGNPPYFVIKTDSLSKKEKKEFMEKKAEAMTGRPNIYISFLYKCLKEHLLDDGFLAFILPTSLYNCSYYQPMRNYIQKYTTICHLENLDKPGFFETGQKTMLIILQKRKTNDDFIFRAKTNSQNVYISPFYQELYDITRNTQTLADLGLGVKTGNVIWNDVKANLSDSGTLLVYSSNIKTELKLNNLTDKTKKQYVQGLDKPTISGPVILVERGYGNTFNFNSVLVDLKDFYAENHVNVIYAKTPEAVGNLARVIASFQDERSMKFIKWFIGNGSISSTDIETILPIFMF
jgi:adenine-specific DNA-methyltransferase